MTRCTVLRLKLLRPRLIGGMSLELSINGNTHEINQSTKNISRNLYLYDSKKSSVPKRYQLSSQNGVISAGRQRAHHVPRPTGRDSRAVFYDYLTCPMGPPVCVVSLSIEVNGEAVKDVHELYLRSTTCLHSGYEKEQTRNAGSTIVRCVGLRWAVANQDEADSVAARRRRCCLSVKFGTEDSLSRWDGVYGGGVGRVLTIFEKRMAMRAGVGCSVASEPVNARSHAMLESQELSSILEGSSRVTAFWAAFDFMCRAH
ncbi:hypothetical protein PR048_025529 [Dryococelus australis]|uniref:Uncharacterized protein n=1 Tax=Dryococelus australis TaxID=614101 RepID=A0ABQ9GRM7_9NEOP|nr:hypothetical protein PR048_025529 [Dryococelus australis]